MKQFRLNLTQSFFFKKIDHEPKQMASRQSLMHIWINCVCFACECRYVLSKNGSHHLGGRQSLCAMWLKSTLNKQHFVKRKSLAHCLLLIQQNESHINSMITEPTSASAQGEHNGMAHTKWIDRLENYSICSPFRMFVLFLFLPFDVNKKNKHLIDRSILIRFNRNFFV